MKFDGIAYEVGYWCARSGQPGLALSASMRVGYQHGAVDRALDSTEVTGGLRDLLREVSRHHNSWRAAARVGCRSAQAIADALSRTFMQRLVGEPTIESVSPALFSRLKIAPGIQLVI